MVSQSLIQQSRQKALSWLQEKYYDSHTRSQVQKLLNSKNPEPLVNAFSQNLNFGTGGIRAPLGVGSNRINVYTASQIAQGISHYLASKIQTPRYHNVVIAYDSRSMAFPLALKIALVFCANQFKVFLFSSLRPTPILSFAVLYFHSIAGIMVTASHNPPHYQGIKVYSKLGAQILPPDDSLIIQQVLKITSQSQVKSITHQIACKTQLLRYIPHFHSVDQLFYQKARQQSLQPPHTLQKIAPKIHIVFTPLHGSGLFPVTHILKKSEFQNVHLVTPQTSYDPRFPTLHSPNPEEPSAFNLAIPLAQKKNAQIILATDPDADRIGVAVQSQNQQFILLNGNEIGIILLYYILSQKKNLPNHSFVVKSIVSSDLAIPICQDFNVQLLQTFTGFKYIIHAVLQYPQKNYLFSFEESYGYHVGHFVRDKDAITTSLLISELAALCNSQNITLLDYLNSIFVRYGYYSSALSSLSFDGQKGSLQIQQIMQFFRNQCPASIADTPVLQLRDFQKKSTHHSNPHPFHNQANVLSLLLKDDSQIILRPSGTEPKIKFYISSSQKVTQNSLLQTKSKIQKKIKILNQHLIAKIHQILA